MRYLFIILVYIIMSTNANALYTTEHTLIQGILEENIPSYNNIVIGIAQHMITDYIWSETQMSTDDILINESVKAILYILITGVDIQEYIMLTLRANSIDIIDHGIFNNWDESILHPNSNISNKKYTLMYTINI